MHVQVITLKKTHHFDPNEEYPQISTDNSVIMRLVQNIYGQIDLNKYINLFRESENKKAFCNRVTFYFMDFIVL